MVSWAWRAPDINAGGFDLRGEAEEASPHWTHARAHTPPSGVYATKGETVPPFSVINLTAVLPYRGR